MKRKKKESYRPSRKFFEDRINRLEKALESNNRLMGDLHDQVARDKQYTYLGRALEQAERLMLDMKIRVISQVKDENIRTALFAGAAGIVPTMMVQWARQNK